MVRAENGWLDEDGILFRLLAPLSSAIRSAFGSPLERLTLMLSSPKVEAWMLTVPYAFELFSTQTPIICFVKSARKGHESAYVVTS